MSGLLKYLETERDKAAAAARAVLAKSEDRGDEITPEEKAEVDAHLETFKLYNAKAQAEKSKIDIREQLESETGVASQVAPVTIEGDPGMPRTLGEAFVKSGSWRAIAEGHKSGQLGRKWHSAAVELPWHLRKAAASPVLESNNQDLFGDGTDAGAFTTLGGLQTPGFVQIPPVIADLIPTIPVTVGNSVTYPVVDDRTPVGYPGDQPVNENATKPSALYSFTTHTEVLKKLAALCKFSSEFLEDAPGLAAYINADLPLQIRLAEDAYLAQVLYDAAGSSSTLTGGSKWDAILGAITEVRMAGFVANGVVIAADNWAEVLTEIPTSGDGHYISGTGPQSANPLSAWGVRVIISSAAGDDTPLVGDFNSGAKLYRKGGLSVDSTNSDEDDFQNNIITIRAEERMVLGVTYPEAFVTASL